MKLSKHVETVYETTEWFTGAMKDVLLQPENLQKSHWRDDTETQLVEKLTAKVNKYLRESQAKEEIKQLIDISNYSMMLADKIRQDYLDQEQAFENGG